MVIFILNNFRERDLNKIALKARRDARDVASWPPETGVILDGVWKTGKQKPGNGIEKSGPGMEIGFLTFRAKHGRRIAKNWPILKIQISKMVYTFHTTCWKQERRCARPYKKTAAGYIGRRPKISDFSGYFWPQDAENWPIWPLKISGCSTPPGPHFGRGGVRARGRARDRGRYQIADVRSKIRDFPGKKRSQIAESCPILKI